MKDEYSTPRLEFLGELRELTAASAGGPLADVVQGIILRLGKIVDGSN